MTFEEALIEHCFTLAGKARQPVPLLSQGQRPFARAGSLRPAAVRRPGTGWLVIPGTLPHGLPSPASHSYRERDLAEVLGRREHRDFLRAMGYTPWEAPGDCLRQQSSPASVWRRNSPTRSASFWAILWMT